MLGEFVFIKQGDFCPYFVRGSGRYSAAKIPQIWPWGGYATESYWTFQSAAMIDSFGQILAPSLNIFLGRTLKSTLPLLDPSLYRDQIELILQQNTCLFLRYHTTGTFVICMKAHLVILSWQWVIQFLHLTLLLYLCRAFDKILSFNNQFEIFASIQSGIEPQTSLIWIKMFYHDQTTMVTYGNTSFIYFQTF